MKKQTTYIVIGLVLVAVAIYYYMKKQSESAPVVESVPAPEKKSTGTKNTTSTNHLSVIDRYKVLKLGSKGEEVKLIQKILRPFSLNKVSIDGSFGPLTEGWLKTYKGSKGIQGNPSTTSVAELNADGKSQVFGI